MHEFHPTDENVFIKIIIIKTEKMKIMRTIFFQCTIISSMNKIEFENVVDDDDDTPYHVI